MVIISLKKQRQINLSEISLTGSITSVKNNTNVEFESSLERDFIYLLEYNTDVKRYYEQPIKIKYYEDDKSKVYIPDFIIEYFSGKRSIVEIKYKEDLEKNKDAYAKKFKATQEFCIKNNFHFKILNENDIRTYKLFNAKFLLYYQDPLIQVNYGYVKQIYQTIKKFTKITAKELIDETVYDEYSKAELIYVLWYMVANHLLDYNKNCKLTMNSIISINN